ncbi:DgyrCDS10969 [Dimorphilus gyrociliatus]|uniref:DgyrCDS10969 n=1 Tax=Dimorphilus gyrociliatus TaxID=2664684 RepID=A0A7I8W1Y5_9ANNE|nr:DgyrCDS10969 [Dimorphilus gyrociliatus]
MEPQITLSLPGRIYDSPDSFERENFTSPGRDWKTTPQRSRIYSPRQHFRRTPGACRPPTRVLSSTPPSGNTVFEFPVCKNIEGSGSSLLSVADLASNVSGIGHCHPQHQSTPQQHTPPQQLQPQQQSTPQSQSSLSLSQQSSSQQPSFELHVTNLDYNISAREWRKILCAEFQQHVTVLSVEIATQPDNTNIGIVRVPTEENARYAISQLHRRKIGYKRVHVQLVQNENLNTMTDTLKSDIIRLLKDVAGNTLPLFKFIELFEQRHHRSVSVAELYKLRDTVEVWENSGGRMISISQTVQMNQSTSTDISQIDDLVCAKHCPENSSDYATALDSCSLPNVLMSLRILAPRIHTLVAEHGGSLPMLSLATCYAATFEPLEAVENGGVPLEHLITCVSGVRIVISSPSGVKKVEWQGEDVPRGSSSPLMTQQLGQFAREVADLLKHSPKCSLPFSKFIPAYHHHFGRQCRVADYGYTKLIELLDAVGHVVQVLGAGSRRVVTLTHRAHVKRFTGDVTKVLKSLPGKQARMCELQDTFVKVMGKPLEPCDYGVCVLEDIMADVPDQAILIMRDETGTIFSLPRRQQTPAEMERTRHFTKEVIELLRHSPRGRLPFSKFIPAYHHHFGRQCRVSDYGFTKLIELLEAVSHVAHVSDDEHGDKTVVLAKEQMIKVLEEQLAVVLRATPTLALQQLPNAFLRQHGHSIRLEDYGVRDTEQLISLIPGIARVVTKNDQKTIVAVDAADVARLVNRLLLLLMDTTFDGCMEINTLINLYHKIYKPDSISEVEIRRHLEDKVTITDNIVRLQPLQLFARDVRTLLLQAGGRMSAANLEEAYSSHFGVVLVPATYGRSNLLALLDAVPHVVVVHVRGRGQKRTISLTQAFCRRENYEEKTFEKATKKKPTSLDMAASYLPDIDNLTSESTSPESEIKDSEESGFESSFSEQYQLYTSPSSSVL